jgi:hypothetical protein
MGAECEPTFKVEIIKNHWSWKKFDDVNEIILCVEERDWWKVVEQVNQYIISNNINDKVVYPDWYRFLKPIC